MKTRTHTDPFALYAYLQDVKRRMFDVVVPQSMLTAEVKEMPGGSVPTICVPTEDGFTDVVWTDHTAGQLADKLGIPLRFFRKCQEAHAVELCRMLNYWFRQGESEQGDKPQKVTKRLLRVTDNNGIPTLRAFLSNSYRIIDNLHVLEVALEKMAGLCQERGGKPECFNWNATTNHMDVLLFDTSMTSHLGLFTEGKQSVADHGTVGGGGDWRNLRGTINDPGYEESGAVERMATGEGRSADGSDGGDIVFGGVHIRNSETGDGSLWVRTCALVAVCSNRVLIGLDMAQVHLGKQMTEDTVLSPETRKLENEVIWAKVRDAVTAAMDKEKFEELLDLFRGTAKIELPSVTEAAKQIVEKQGWTDEQRDSILNAFRPVVKDRPTVFDAIQAVTEAAQKFEQTSPERCLEMEVAASSWITGGEKATKAYFGVRSKA